MSGGPGGLLAVNEHGSPPLFEPPGEEGAKQMLGIEMLIDELGLLVFWYLLQGRDDIFLCKPGGLRLYVLIFRIFINLELFNLFGSW